LFEDELLLIVGPAHRLAAQQQASIEEIERDR
jgi:hypothetical protein